MEKELYSFPPISGRGDLPAGIYLTTMSPDEIEKRRSLGYKLVVPIARYTDKHYLSIGAEGFFLSRIMEYVCEISNVTLYHPLWISEEGEDLIGSYLKGIENFGFDVILLREYPSLYFPSKFRNFTIKEMFENFSREDYDKYKILFYLALIPEFTHIEKMEGVKNKKVDFSIYNKGLELLGKFISYIVNTLK